MKLYNRPTTITAARKWVKQHHRHLPDVQGGMWAVGVYNDDGLCGVAIVGNPPVDWMKKGALGILRVCTDGAMNACSLLYGACSRAARAMGATDLVTYTLPEEGGASMRAANFVFAGITNPGRDYRTGRKNLLPFSKHRWLAPWGVEAKKILAAG